MQQRPQAGLTPKLQVTLRVNGVERRVSLRPWTTLLDALREYLDLTGTKKGSTTANAAPARCSSMDGASSPA